MSGRTIEERHAFPTWERMGGHLEARLMGAGIARRADERDALDVNG